ncbi:MAG TPA: hypothetical protein VK436_00665 [Methanocella sp.]|nr:hypothetical protein [Methanocella sp.]
MSYGIPASEFLAICMIMADFDLEVSALKVIQGAEKYQDLTGSEFGEGRGDFRGAFYEIIASWRPEGISIQMGEPQRFLGRTPLKDWIGVILRYDHVWFDEEGETWSTVSEDHDWPVGMRRRSSWKDENGKRYDRTIRDYLGDPIKIKASLRFDYSFRRIFAKESYSRADIHRLFKRSRYGREIPKQWSVHKPYSRLLNIRA